jgi:tRNA/rRNA methyltransferase/tRNA (cytidine32/uridine32-2'-O)-methyltransferase
MPAYQVAIEDSVYIILCRPQDSGNVGAVCRAMLNFGFYNLRVVHDSTLPPLDGTVIKTRAVHADVVWDNAGHFESLEEAVSDCGLVVGTSRRRGKERKRLTWTADEAAAFVAERLVTNAGKQSNAADAVATTEKVAFMFGNERTGLETEELRCCNVASYIPANDAFPSLNLSHAVQVYTHELFKALRKAEELAAAKGAGRTWLFARPEGSWEPLALPHIEKVVASISGELERKGFYRKPGREMQEEFLRDIFCRAGITYSEAQYMKKIILKSAHLDTHETYSDSL